MTKKAEIVDGKYTTKADGEELLATAKGYYAGAQIEPGQKFRVRDKGEVFSWASPEDAVETKRKAEGGYLAGSVRDIVGRIKDLSDRDLKAYRNEEAAGEQRKSVLTAFDDELANRTSNPTVPGGAGKTEKGGGNDERRFGGGIPGSEPNPDDAVKAGKDPFK